MQDHDFLPVAGHPDDDECTHRADGTDGTYCGEQRVLHEYDGRERPKKNHRGERVDLT